VRKDTPRLRRGRRGGYVRDDERRARIMAAVTEHDTAAGAGELVQRLCMFAVEEMARRGALVLATAFASGCSMHDIAQNVAERRVRFDG
jgi:hypothetical protein